MDYKCLKRLLAAGNGGHPGTKHIININITTAWQLSVRLGEYF